jgi:hypothetical protein
MNEAKALTAQVLGKEAENYPEKFNMDDLGNLPLALLQKMPSSQAGSVDSRLQTALTATQDLTGNSGESNQPDGELEEGADDVEMNLDNSKKTTSQLDAQINKAARNGDDEVVAVMKEVRRLLIQMGGDADEAE